MPVDYFLAGPNLVATGLGIVQLIFRAIYPAKFPVIIEAGTLLEEQVTLSGPEDVTIVSVDSSTSLK